jgi:2-polyprenyl-6-methoxyphenol hydroxylase-like FAD-dependent oxidoreductase
VQTAHRKKVLIAGSGVAGASLAQFLHRDGHSVTMIDVSPEPEEGGFVLQLNHDAMRIVRQLGAERQVKEAGEAARRMTARFGRGRSKVDVPISVGAAITMRRGDLARVLIEHAEQDVSLQSGVGITAIRQEVGRAVAYLTDGRAEDFDVIVGADGLHSTVRKLTVGHDDDIYRNGLKNIWFTVPYPMAPDERSVVFQHGRDVVQVLPFPGRRETLVIVTTHDLGPAHQDEQQLRARAAQAIARSAPAYLRPLSSAVHDSEKVKVTLSSRSGSTRGTTSRPSCSVTAPTASTRCPGSALMPASWARASCPVPWCVTTTRPPRGPRSGPTNEHCVRGSGRCST